MLHSKLTDATTFYLFIYSFICAYNVWVISPHFRQPPTLPPQPLTTRQKLFCPYL
jgi:hypothetical protein